MPTLQESIQANSHSDSIYAVLNIVVEIEIGISFGDIRVWSPGNVHDITRHRYQGYALAHGTLLRRCP